MTRIIIKIEDDQLGGVEFTSGAQIYDHPMFGNPDALARTHLEKLLDDMVDKIKVAYKIEPGTLDDARLGRSVGLVLRDDTSGGMTDEELGKAIIEMMARLPEQAPRPIRDSPQA